MYLYKYRCVRSDLLLSPSLFDWEELCTIDDKAIPYLSSLCPCEAPAGQWNKPCSQQYFQDSSVHVYRVSVVILFRKHYIVTVCRLEL